MTREELLRIYNSESYDNYVKYLVKHWKDESQKGNWEALVSDHFADAHSVEGTISENKAVDICRERSHQGANDFTSTILTTKFIIGIVQYIAANIIEWHGKNRRDFTNYKVSAKGMMITVECQANKGFLPKQYRDEVVVGINHAGLITHFHGDASYARGDIYGKDGNTIKKLR